MDYEETMDAMAEALWNEIRRQENTLDLGAWKDLTDAGKKPYIIQIKAAFKALQDKLPELTKKEPMSGFVDRLVITDAPKLYNQLKNLGRENE